MPQLTVCSGVEMTAFPLTVVHERGKKYTLDELTKINQAGYRPGNMVVDELIRKIKIDNQLADIQWINSNNTVDIMMSRALNRFS